MGRWVRPPLPPENSSGTTEPCSLNYTREPSLLSLHPEPCTLHFSRL